MHWERDASYSYYRHGPLARTELGNNRVQGLAYAYTLQGWLKGVNSTGLFRNGGNDDMGKDATPTASPVPGYGDNSLVGADEFGFALHYNHKDYRPTGGSLLKPFVEIDIQQSPIYEQDTIYYQPLYNGNIAGMTTNIPGLTAPRKTGRNYTEYTRFYRYDQLNRLTIAQSFPWFFRNTNTIRFWRDNSTTELFSYDKNGNLVDVTRFGMRPAGGIGKMDVLRYFYTAGTNRLNRVRDTWSSTGDFDTDLENQPVDNYAYNAIGNLISDSSEGITRIAWTVYGKIDSIYKSNGTIISYRYDAGGNRILKKVNSAETIYVRDASGNVMSTYTNDGAGLWQRELHLYGSSRIGLQQVAVNLSNPEPEKIKTVFTMSGKARTFERGNKFFELSNHLGNVLVTVSDRRRSTANTGNPALVSRYQAVVLSAQDYFSFGMIMPGRSFQSTAYRYGFNGKENDNEVKGSGNQQDYGMRIYDPRVGRFLSVDPMAPHYPWYTPYQFAGNKPIAYVDLDGLEDVHYVFTWTKDNAVIKLTGWQEGKLVGTDKNGLPIYDRPHKIHAHYPVFLKDEVYFVTASYDSEEAFRKAKARDFTSSVIKLGTLLGYQEADDLMDKVQLALGLGALKSSLKQTLKNSLDALATLSVKESKELAEQSTKSIAKGQVANLPEQILDNAAHINSLGLKDGMKLNWKEGLEKAEAFLGRGYKEVSKGRFVSADGSRVVRMGEHELSGKAPLHLNFETLVPNAAKPGKPKVEKNLHIFLDQ